MSYRVIKLAIASAGLSIVISGSVYADFFEKPIRSSKLGVEAKVGSAKPGNWCSDKIDVLLTANEAGFYKSKNLPVFVSRLGKFLSQQCPAVQEFNVSGKQKGQESYIYAADALANNNWSLTEKNVEQAVTVIAPPPPPPVKAKTSSANEEVAVKSAGLTSPPPPRKPLAQWSLSEVHSSVKEFDEFGPGGAFNLIGDWRAEYICKRYGREEKDQYTLSIFYQKGEAYKAYLMFDTLKKRNGGIFIGNGHFIQSHNQFSFENTKELRDGEAYHPVINASYDADKKAFIERVDSNCETPILRKINDKPLRAIEFKRSISFAEKIHEWGAARNVRGSILGKLPGSKVKFPGCHGLLVWASSFPNDKRIAINQPNKDKMLLHYQDDITRKVFGKPAYDWTKQDSKLIGNGFYKHCRKKLDRKSYRFVDEILGDSDSFDAIKDRRYIDHQIVNYPSALVESGSSNINIYLRFHDITQNTHALERAIGSNYKFSGWALPTDWELARAEAKTYADYYSILALNEYAEMGRKLADKENPFKAAQDLLVKIKAVKGNADTEAAVIDATNVVNENLQLAAKDKVEKLTSGWSSGFASFDEFNQANNQVADFKTMAGASLPEGLSKKLDGDLRASMEKSADGLLAAEVEKLKTVSPQDQPSMQGISKTLRDIILVEDGFNQVGLNDAKTEYVKEANVIRASLLDAALANIQKQYEDTTAQKILKKPVEQWANYALRVEAMPDKLQKMFGSYDISAKAKPAAKAIRKDVDKKIKFALKTKMAELFQKKADQYLTMKELNRLIVATSKPIYPFEQKEVKNLNDYQVSQAKILLKEISGKQEEVVKFLSRRIENEIQTALKSEKDSREFYRIWGDSKQLSNGLRHHVKEHRVLKDLQEEWADASKILSEEICKTKYELDDDDAEIPVLVGSGLSDLGTLNCAFKINGSELTDYEDPGFMGEKIYSMKLLTRKGYMTVKLKLLELGPDKKGLVGYSFFDGVKEETINREQWSAFSLMTLLSAENRSGANLGSRKFRDDSFDNKLVYQINDLIKQFGLVF